MSRRRKKNTCFSVPNKRIVPISRDKSSPVAAFQLLLLGLASSAVAFVSWAEDRDGGSLLVYAFTRICLVFVFMRPARLLAFGEHTTAVLAQRNLVKPFAGENAAVSGAVSGPPRGRSGAVGAVRISSGAFESFGTGAAVQKRPPPEPPCDPCETGAKAESQLGGESSQGTGMCSADQASPSGLVNADRRETRDGLERVEKSTYDSANGSRAPDATRVTPGSTRLSLPPAWAELFFVMALAQPMESFRLQIKVRIHLLGVPPEHGPIVDLFTYHVHFYSPVILYLFCQVYRWFSSAVISLVSFSQ